MNVNNFSKALANMLIICSIQVLANGQTNRVKPSTLSQPSNTQKAKASKSNANNSGATSKSPTLKETIDWIKNNLEISGGQENDKFVTKYSSVAYEGGVFAYRIVGIVRVTGGSSISQVKFLLRDIDASSISVAEDKLYSAFTVNFKTIDKKASIKADNSMLLNGAGFYFPDKDLANRFAQALAHAVKLVQSQKEPF